MTDRPPSPVSPRRRRSGWAFVAVLVAFAMLPIVAILRDRLTAMPADHIAWRTDFAAALRDAAASGRPVLIDATASWCPPCQEMKRSTWPDPRVGDAIARSFTPVMLDVDVPASAAVAQHYGIIEIPTVLILERDGNVRDVGSLMNAGEMLAFLSKNRTPTTQP